MIQRFPFISTFYKLILKRSRYAAIPVFTHAPPSDHLLGASHYH